MTTDPGLPMLARGARGSPGARGGGMATGRLAAVAFVIRNPNLRRLHLGRLLWQSAELAHVVALLVFAYERGGASEVALFGVMRTAAAASMVSLVAVLGDRAPRATVLTGGALLGATALAAAALATSTDSGSLTVYGTSALAAVAMAAYRPTSAALAPSLVQRPAELVAHNVVGTVVEGTTALAGPVLGAVLVDRLGVAGALTVTSLAVLGAALLFGGLRRSIGTTTPPRQERARTPLRRDLSAGFRQIAGDPTARLLTVVGGAQTMVRGALHVLVVVLAVDLLDVRETFSGVLLAAIGVGSLLGTLLTVRVVGGGRLGRTLALGLTLWGAPVAVVAFAPAPAVAVAVLAVIGLGNNLVDVSLFTLLQRSVPNDVLARVMGALETALQATMALGAVVAALALDRFGDRGALVALGALLPAVALIALPSLAAIDRRTEVRDADVSLLQQIPLFAPLPLVDVELLAGRLSEATRWVAGSDVVRAGDAGDTYFVIEDGDADVVVDGVPSTRLGRGGGFGEIALLRAVPRVATVRAATDLSLRTLGRDDFLAVVTGHPGSRAAAEDAVDAMLDDRVGSDVAEP